MAFIRVLLFVLLFIFTSKAWSKESTPLVFVYCDYLTSSHSTMEDNEKGWADLVRRFERRELITQKTLLSESPKFQECVRKNSTLFETGEFIFEGKNRVQESLGVLQSARAEGPTLVATDFTLTDSSIISEYYSVALESKEGTWSAANMEKDLRSRQARYSTLWNDFLDTVRENMTEPKLLNSFK